MLSSTCNRRRWLSARAFLAGALVVSCMSAAAQAQQARGVDRLLPEETLFVVSVDDQAAYSKSLEDMPLSKIMAEPEVQTFLEKPKQMMKDALGKLQDQIRQEEGFENFELSLDDLMAGSYGRVFLALTHVKMPDPQAGMPFPDVGLVIGIEGRQGAPDWQAVIKELVMRAAGGSGTEVAFKPVTGDAYSYEEMSSAKWKGPPVVMGRVGDLQLFSISREALKMVMDRASGNDQRGSLADNPNYQTSLRAIGIDTSAAARVFANTDLGFRTLAEVAKMALAKEHMADKVPLVDQLLEKSGLLALKSISSGGVSENGVAVSRSFVRVEGERKGLLKVSPDKPIDLDVLNTIPKDTASFSIFQVNPAALFDVVMDMIKTVDESEYQQAQGMLTGIGAQIAGEGNPPLDIRKDILGNIGPEFLMMQPQSANAMMPSLLWLAEVRNADTVMGSLKSVLEFASSMSGGQFSLKSTSYKDNTIYQIDVGSEMGLPLSPCFGVVGDRLCLSLNVGDLKRHIRRQEKGGPSIVENEEFQRFFSKLPKDGKVSSLSYSDVRFAVESAYSQVVMMLPMLSMAADVELPFDMALLPTQETITKHLYSSLSYSLFTDDGMVAQGYSPVGGEVLGLALAGGIGAGLLVGVRAEEASHAVEAEPLAPSPVEETPADRVRYDLSTLKTGVTIYKLQQSKLPDTLDQLLEPSDAYPNGCLGRDSLPVDPWGNTYRYQTRESGGYILWSLGENGVDEGGAGDDIVVEKK